MSMHLPCMADQDIEIWGQSFLKILTSSGLSVTILLIVDLLFKFCGLLDLCVFNPFDIIFI